jgi:hypothetical protein
VRATSPIDQQIDNLRPFVMSGFALHLHVYLLLGAAASVGLAFE